MGKRVIIDTDECIGCESCVELCSEVFVFNEEKYISLHMLLVFYPIDIIFLDKNKKVVDLKHKAKPFELHIRSKHTAKYVIELQEGIINKTRTALGDLIEF